MNAMAFVISPVSSFYKSSTFFRNDISLFSRTKTTPSLSKVFPRKPLICCQAPKATNLHPNLPNEAREITDLAACKLLECIQFTSVDVPEISPQAITTSHFCTYSTNSLNDNENGNVVRNVILLLHGFDSSVLEFRELVPQLETLGRGQRVEIRGVDIFGWGFTEKPETKDLRYGVKEKREHLRRYVEQVIGIGDNVKFTLVGCSLGGAVALDFMLEWGEYVDKVVLVDPEVLKVRKASGGILVESLGIGLLESYALRRFALELAFYDGRFKTKEYVKIGKLHCYSSGWKNAMVRFLNEEGYSVGERLNELDGKNICVVWGRQDKIVKPENAKLIERSLGTCKLVLIDECGHIPHIEKPEETAKAILDFALDGMRLGDKKQSSENTKAFERQDSRLRNL
eukprot:Plantae.Rhodophyta-Hildenbrandia_rubra.ctg18004.p1 GENE.Plantae.Rhodophyta-Hildenbrandia_rubra.ctg18004~~Plantae.Rhodophyta-Hildenbrandia_rubra.ctg18004.p1  ORF type:complete len:399 (-),score=54.81 Plantae.Rhodophyta-Hildenbrandia_rubra.ctg18004:880-2076(-)